MWKLVEWPNLNIQWNFHLVPQNKTTVVNLFSSCNDYACPLTVPVRSSDICCCPLIMIAHLLNLLSCFWFLMLISSRYLGSLLELIWPVCRYMVMVLSRVPDLRDWWWHIFLVVSSPVTFKAGRSFLRSRQVISSSHTKLLVTQHEWQNMPISTPC